MFSRNFFFGAFGAAAPPAADELPNTFIIAAGQQCAAREVAGYAVAFAALGALLAGTPQQAGAAEYTVGTHQAAIAAAQPKPQVWGPQPEPVVVVANIIRPIFTLPQQCGESYGKIFGASLPHTGPATVIGAHRYTFGTHQAAMANAQPKPQLWGPQPPPVVAAFDNVRQIFTQPQPYTNLAAYVHGTTPDSPRPLLKAIIAPPQQADDPYARLWGMQPEGIDKPPAKTGITLRQQFDEPYAKLWGMQPEGIDHPPAKTTVVPPQQADDPYGRVWGPEPEPIVVVAEVVGKFLLVAPQPDSYRDAHVSGTTPDSPRPLLSTLTVDPQPYSDIAAYVHGTAPPDNPRPLLNTIVVGPQPYTDVAAYVRGTAPASVVVVDTPIGRFLFEAPAQVESGDVWIWSTTTAVAEPEEIPPRPPINAAPQQYEPGSAKLWGLEPTTASALIGSTLTAAPEQVPSGFTLLWGPQPSGIDRPIGTLMVAAPEQVPSGYTTLWGPHPQGIDRPLSKALFASPQLAEPIAPLVWGFTPPTVVGTDVPVGSFSFYVQSAYEPVQFGLRFGQELATFTAPPAPPVTIFVEEPFMWANFMKKFIY